MKISISTLFFFGKIAIIAMLIPASFAYQNLSAQSYNKTELLFNDPCSGTWQERWMLDGSRSKVINTRDGMELIAGPEFGNDSCHAVLWTRQSFEGNICIEYDYTRTDNANRAVNILYFMASGKGDDEFPEDISLWNEKRKVPHMKTYFNNMHTYHLSYAAFPNSNLTEVENDYIRLRRYDPENTGLNDTDVPGDYFNTGLFKTGETYHIEIYRFGSDIEMHVSNTKDPREKKIFKWDASKYPGCDKGRIGLRHMYTRSARYKNFQVWRIMLNNNIKTDS